MTGTQPQRFRCLQPAPYNMAMRTLGPLTPGELAIAEDRLRNPAPGGRIEAARAGGVDLTLLIEQLRLTPAERVRNMHALSVLADEVRGGARRAR